MTLAVVGATGAVGRVLLQVLPTRAVVWDRVKLAASREDVGQTITVGGRDLVVEALTEEFFDGVDVAVVYVIYFFGPLLVRSDVLDPFTPRHTQRLSEVVVSRYTAFTVADNVEGCQIGDLTVDPSEVAKRIGVVV